MTFQTVVKKGEKIGNQYLCKDFVCFRSKSHLYDCIELFTNNSILDRAKFNSLLNNKLLDVTKLKAYADDKLNFATMIISPFDTVENTCREKEKMLVTSIFAFSHSDFQSFPL